MKNIFYLFTAFTLLISSCNNISGNRFSSKSPISIQPLHEYDTASLWEIKQQLSVFFNRPVTILPTIEIPPAFINRTKGERYSADSILGFLKNRADAYGQVVGITHKDIFTTVRDKKGKIQEPRSAYEVWGIFGLARLPGECCVVSDFRLKTHDPKKFKRRLKTVLIHEIGHNYGLPHCPNSRCIMNDANEKISTVDNSADDFCTSCKKTVGK